MDSTRWTIVGAVTVSLVAVAIFWATLPESGPPTVTPPPPAPVAAARPVKLPSVKPSPRPAGPAAQPRRPAGPRAKAASAEGGAPGRKGAKARQLQGREIPEDVLQMIDEARAERVASSTEKLSAYAELAEWDAATTDAVHNLVQAAHDDVDTLLSDATAGDVPWTEVKGEVRRIRVDQARAVRDELGEEEFRRFAKAMGRSRGRRGGPR